MTSKQALQEIQKVTIQYQNVEIDIPLKYLSNFWICIQTEYREIQSTTDIPLINWEVSLILTWSANCVITDKTYREAAPAQGDNQQLELELII